MNSARNKQSGIIQLLPLLFLLIGLGVALYLVGTKTNLLPKASGAREARLEIVDSGGNVVSSMDEIGRTEKREVLLRVVYEPEPLPTPTPTPVNTDPVSNSGEWGLDWVILQAGIYKLTFANANGEEMWSDRVEIRDGQTVEVKANPENQKLEINYFPTDGVNFGSGRLRVETVPASPLRITAERESATLASPPPAIQDLLYPAKVRFANSEAELEGAKEYEFTSAILPLTWVLEEGAGEKTVYGQYTFEDGEGWRNFSPVRIQLVGPDVGIRLTPTPPPGISIGPVYDLVSMYRDPDVSKTHYLHENLTAKDLERHPDWNPESPRNSLWFEQQDQWTFRQFNYSPSDANRYCSYDQLSVWDDNYFRYIASGRDHPQCANGQQRDRTEFEPPMIYMPRSWDEREGPWGLAGISEQVDKVDGSRVCSKTNYWVNEVLGWEELSPRDRAIHVRTSQRTTNIDCPYGGNEVVWEENYWLGALPVEGGGEAWGLKRSMGGQVEEYYRRPECQLNRDDYAVDEITRIQQERNCPTYWDIWFDTWKRLP